MIKKTVVRRDSASTPELFSGAIHPVLARIFCARGVTSMDQLGQGLNELLPYHELRDIECAAQLLYDAVSRSQCILIVADFDADGATSCALAVRALRLLGASAANIKYIVPNRFEYGYGLTPEIVAVASEQNPDLIITVDNGISSVDGVAAAQARGIRVLVTDHHLPGAVLPAAECIVNPNQGGDSFGSKNLAGVGVIFYVMLALRAKMRDEGWFAQRGINAPNLAQLLDLVALGTVADVVPLDRNNRILVFQGLARIAAGRCCAGIQALLDVSGRNAARIVATDLGFAVAPRLNAAAGRLEDMAQGIECLLSDDPGVASEMAQKLDSLNRERRSIENEMRQQALSALDALDDTLGVGSDAIAAGLCLYDESWHQGVIGILASRIKEKLHRPVIAFAPSTESGEIKGSARSVPGVHIKDVLEAIAAQHPDMLKKFGGHAMAAGLT
ncbi:MAG: single-stranded-DNA-specific exonuclease RecJ, partial [Gammaproteobacteria bacterium]|nr:single-stranded-DNA-specific exonuclease RecJ [Gammaproteobacteria bacterium]